MSDRQEGQTALEAAPPWVPSEADVERVARICHEANRAYCVSIDDLSQPGWENARKWQKDSARAAVRVHFARAEAAGRDSHEGWMELKLREGWRYGELKDAESKTHPCLLPYDALPAEQRLKDDIFGAIIAGYAAGMRREHQR